MTYCVRCGQKMETNKKQQIYECTNQACGAKLPMLTMDLYRYYNATIPKIIDGKKKYIRKGIKSKKKRER